MMKNEKEMQTPVEINSIRVISADRYVIEVNDNGDTIEFDVTDIGLPFALERAYRMFDQASAWVKSQRLLFNKQPQTVKPGDIMTAREKFIMKTYEEYYRKMRAAIDEFAGEGASNKIFGKKNYLEMFNDFMKQMEPHLDRMQLRTVDIGKRIEEKYGVSADDEL